MAAYAARRIEFVDGQVTQDQPQDNSGLRHAV
jgi:hypothetical protein